MRQRFVRIEFRNAGVVVTVSDRALSVLFPMLISFAQDGMSPQRIVVNWRTFLPCSFRTVRTGCVGAMLYRGRSSISSPVASKRSTRYCFECVNLYRLHTYSLTRRAEVSQRVLLLGQIVSTSFTILSAVESCFLSITVALAPKSLIEPPSWYTAVLSTMINRS